MLIKKRGISHVEIILSFILFIAAISVGFYFLNPGNVKKIADSSLDYAFREIIKNTSTEIYSFGIKINNEVILEDENQNQEKIEVIAINLYKEYFEMGPRVVTLDGKSLASKIENGLVYVKSNSEGWSRIEFVNIFLSREFANNDLTSAELRERYYELASMQKQEIMSEREFENLVRIYYLDYYGLKKEFNLPNRVNFGFSIIVDNEKISAEREIPDKTEVFSSSRDLPILRKNGEKVFGTLAVSVW